jgi:hypothetical protein
MRAREFALLCQKLTLPELRLKYDSEFQSPVGNFFFGRVIVRDNLSSRTGTISLTLPNTTLGS